MNRIVYILIGIFNLFIISKAWALPLHYILKPIQNVFPPIGAIIIIGIFIFLLFHSIRLILYKKDAIKVQIALCIIDPLFRLFSLFIGINQFPDSKHLPLIITISVVYIAIDIAIIFYLRSAKNKKLFVIETIHQNLT